MLNCPFKYKTSRPNKRYWEKYNKQLLLLKTNDMSVEDFVDWCNFSKFRSKYTEDYIGCEMRTIGRTYKECVGEEKCPVMEK